MTITGTVKSVQIISYTNGGPNKEPTPGTVEVGVVLGEWHNDGELKFRVPHGKAAPYQVGREVTLTIKPKGK